MRSPRHIKFPPQKCDILSKRNLIDFIYQGFFQVCVCTCEQHSIEPFVVLCELHKVRLEPVFVWSEDYKSENEKWRCGVRKTNSSPNLGRSVFIRLEPRATSAAASIAHPDFSCIVGYVSIRLYQWKRTHEVRRRWALSGSAPLILIRKTGGWTR